MDSQTRIERNIELGEVEPMISVREANAKLATLRQQVSALLETKCYGGPGSMERVRHNAHNTAVRAALKLMEGRDGGT